MERSNWYFSILNGPLFGTQNVFSRGISTGNVLQKRSNCIFGTEIFTVIKSDMKEIKESMSEIHLFFKFFYLCNTDSIQLCKNKVKMWPG